MTTALSNPGTPAVQHGPTQEMKKGLKMLFEAHLDKDPLRIHWAMDHLAFLHDMEYLADASAELFRDSRSAAE